MPHVPDYSFDDFMEPTVIDPLLSAIQPVKSQFVRANEWLQSEVDTVVDEPEVTQLDSKMLHTKSKNTPWENFVLWAHRAVAHMRENLRN